jgi:hypothetical protein
MSQSQIIYERLKKLHQIVSKLDEKIADERVLFIANEMLFNFVKAEHARKEWERLFNMRAFYQLSASIEQIQYLLAHNTERQATYKAPSNSNA